MYGFAKYVSSLRGEGDLCHLHAGHGSDRELQFYVVGRHCARAKTYIGYPLPEDGQHMITCAMSLNLSVFCRIKVSANTMFYFRRFRK